MFFLHSHFQRYIKRSLINSVTLLNAAIGINIPFTIDEYSGNALVNVTSLAFLALNRFLAGWVPMVQVEQH